MHELPYMPLWCADFLTDTDHLDAEETGAYLLLIMWAWRHGGSIPNEDKRLAQIARCTLRRWQRIASTIKAFFTLKNGELHQKRVDEELKKAIDKSHNLSDAARTRWERKRQAKLLKNNNPDDTDAYALSVKARENSDTESMHEGMHGGYGSDDTSESILQNTEKEEKKESKKEGARNGAPTTGYAFAGMVIKLEHDDYERWRTQYRHIPDFRASLTAADDYYATHPPKDGKWWFPVSRWLKKDNDDALKRKRHDDDDDAIAALYRRMHTEDS